MTKRSNPLSYDFAARGSDDLAFGSTVENGVRFATGQPVTFEYLHNTKRAPRLRAGAKDHYQQRIEPAGRYLLHRTAPNSSPPLGWETGIVAFQNPLVLRLSTDQSSYGPNGWKARLSRRYKKWGAALTEALRRDGYDGIVTVDGPHTMEIVDLTTVIERPRRTRKNPSCVDGWWAR